MADGPSLIAAVASRDRHDQRFSFVSGRLVCLQESPGCRLLLRAAAIKSLIRPLRAKDYKGLIWALQKPLEGP